MFIEQRCHQDKFNIFKHHKRYKNTTPNTEYTRSINIMTENISTH